MVSMAFSEAQALLFVGSFLFTLLALPFMKNPRRLSIKISVKLFDRFISMGFSDKLVSKVIDENGEENAEAILDHLLTYTGRLESMETYVKNNKRGFGADKGTKKTRNKKPYSVRIIIVIGLIDI